MSKNQATIFEILNNNLYIVLGTAFEGSPWVTPLFFSHDSEMNIYWLSQAKSRHSKNIAKSPNVAITCFDSTSPKWSGRGLYMEAVCSVLKDTEEVALALDLIFSRLLEPVPSPADYLKKGFKVYKAVPNKVWITSEKEVFSRVEV